MPFGAWQVPGPAISLWAAELFPSSEGAEASVCMHSLLYTRSPGRRDALGQPEDQPGALSASRLLLRGGASFCPTLSPSYIRCKGVRVLTAWAGSCDL